MLKNINVVSFEGEIETTIMFKYGIDFFMGDIVQFANEYGHESKVRVIEMVRSEDEDVVLHILLETVIE